MATMIMFAVIIAAAVALGWLLRRRRPALGPEPFPGWDQWEGELKYERHASAVRMPERAITEFDIRTVLAEGNCTPSKDPNRTVWEGTAPDGQTLRVITTRQGAALRVITTYWPDPVVTKVKMRGGDRARVLFDNLDRIKELGADISVSKTDRSGGVVVSITSAITSFREDAVKAVEEIANTR